MPVDAFSVTDPEVRDTMVRRLLEQRASGGGYADGAVQRVADICGVHRSIVYRWCDKGTARRRSKEAWRLDDSSRAAIIETNGNLDLAHAVQLERAAPVKSRSTFYRAVQREPDTALVPYARAGAPALLSHRVALRKPRQGPNERWELDHGYLPVEVLLRAGDPKPVQMHFTVVVDCDGGDIVALVLSAPPGPNRGTVLSALSLAIERYGVPNVVACDNDLTFTASAVRQVGAMLDFRIGSLPPYTPEGKGSVERAIGTVKTRFCPLQPFYTEGARRKDRTLHGRETSRLDVQALMQRLDVFVDSHNTKVKVPDLGRRTRSDFRAERAGPLRYADAEDLRALTMERMRRNVRHGGGITIDDVAFFAPELHSNVGRTVSVGMRPFDYSQIEVWLDGRWLCTATPTTRLIEEQQEASRRKKAELNRELGRIRRLMNAQRDRYAPITPEESMPRAIGRAAVEPGLPRETRTRDPLGFGSRIGTVE